ncbi:Hypothetical predicted protein [Mytilus galloprovincialis]|uniref:Uncharacterized protein n=1 Tax=Mytilus galloprovincialis TaxID=29158 RepID=A0A8B6CE50_MYTGA|nr:Hypothetical predicted protein [Mytilus galloprovincialis]
MQSVRSQVASTDAGQSMIGYFHTEMVRLLSKMMGKCVTTRTITAQSDTTKVDFRCKDNQHYNTRIAVGMKVREFLSDNDDLAPLTVNNFFSLSDSFLNYNQQETSQLEDEAAEYMLTPLCDLQAFDPDTPSLNQFLRLLSGKQQFQHQSDPRDNLADKTTHSLLSVKINKPTDCHQYKPEPALVKAANSTCALYKQSLS